MKKVMNIVTTYTKVKGNGKRIYIIRSDGTTREYSYSWRYTVLLYVATMNWRTSVFPGSIHVSRP